MGNTKGGATPSGVWEKKKGLQKFWISLLSEVIRWEGGLNERISKNVDTLRISAYQRGLGERPSGEQKFREGGEI